MLNDTKQAPDIVTAKLNSMRSQSCETRIPSSIAALTAAANFSLCGTSPAASLAYGACLPSPKRHGRSSQTSFLSGATSPTAFCQKTCWTGMVTPLVLQPVAFISPSFVQGSCLDAGDCGCRCGLRKGQQLCYPFWKAVE
ncbi:hypothetical protein LMH87_002535 [Akanthomyces muscarius]|uniref:Uncharacterized protein n=1 Tax=Akanthomyces muscarius TaxID=2231603 RepID=A0A9W8Q795_AKAMU|nr:hypothetical protein LMH87_002535 [Akanthomyces muscarius]KAJ4148047.1 hypothetical protein LMH87_002535 [Akanthomyces muscarius]